MITDDAALLTAAGFLFFALCAALFAGGRSSGKSGHPLLYWGGMLLQVLSAVALPFVRDLLVFFILWEFVSIGTAAILFCEPGRARLLRWYLPIQIASAVALMIAIALHVAHTGSFSIAGGEGLAAGSAFALFAISVKAAVFPLHIWMVETYPQVRPVTTVILSAFGTKTGVFAALRLIPGLAGLELFGAISALLAVLYALRQKTLRRFLSFHIASQIGYMIAGIGAVATTAQLAGVYHLSNHVMYKGLLLMTAAVLARRFSEENMYAIRERAWRTSWPLFLAALIGALSISGVPPFNGFVSKAFLKANVGSDVSYWLLVAASVGTAMSFTKFLWLSFLGGHLEARKAASDPADRTTAWSRPGEGLAMLLLSLACVGMTFLPLVMFPQITLSYPFSVNAIIAGLWPAALGAVGFFLVYRYLLPVLHLMPTGATATRIAAAVWTVWSRSVRSLHTGDLRDSIGWMLVGLIVIWVVMLI